MQMDSMEYVDEAFLGSHFIIMKGEITEDQEGNPRYKSAKPKKSQIFSCHHKLAFF